MVLWVRLDEFGSIPPATQFRLPAAFAIPSVRILHYVSEAVQNYKNTLGSIIKRHRFCAAAQMKMALGSIKNLVAEFATREPIPPLHELMKTIHFSLD